jgi:hypothetical protein
MITTTKTNHDYKHSNNNKSNASFVPPIFPASPSLPPKSQKSRQQKPMKRNHCAQTWARSKTARPWGRVRKDLMMGLAQPCWPHRCNVSLKTVGSSETAWIMTLAHLLRYPAPSSKRPPSRKRTLPQPAKPEEEMTQVIWLLPKNSSLTVWPRWLLQWVHTFRRDSKHGVGLFGMDAETWTSSNCGLTDSSM